MGKKKKKKKSSAQLSLKYRWHEQVFCGAGRTVPPHHQWPGKTVKAHFRHELIKAARHGDTLLIFLYDFCIPVSAWKKFLKKNKWAIRIIKDAEAYAKAFGQIELRKMALNKKPHSTATVKLYERTFYDISDEAPLEDYTRDNQSGYTINIIAPPPELAKKFTKGIWDGEKYVEPGDE